MRHRIGAVLQRAVIIVIMVAVLAPLAVAQRAPDLAAAEPALVFEALRVLQTNYVDPIDPVKLLAAAAQALRARLSAAGLAAHLAEIPADAGEAEARQMFADRFAAAVAAAGTALAPSELSYAAIRGMTESFKDSHTGFLTPQQNAERRSRQRGQAGFTGVGIILMPKEDRYYVWATIPGGPAETAGVRDFDRILGVNGVSTIGMQTGEVSGMIRGLPGTAVTLTLQRPGVADPLDITITRAPITVPSIFKSQLMEGGIGYIKLYQFVEGTARDFRRAVTSLAGQGMRGLVLDLRGNGGGYLHELNGVLNAVLGSNLPVYTEMRQGGLTRVQRTTSTNTLPGAIPLWVLIDEGSASAAELLSAAIQENRRGTLIGEKTAGAVEASIMVDLSDGSALSVTTFRLASGLGVRLEGEGVRPDVRVTLTTFDLDMGQDRTLGMAVRMARQVIALPSR